MERVIERETGKTIHSEILSILNVKHYAHYDKRESVSRGQEKHEI